MAWRWSWLGWRRKITKPAGVSTVSTHVRSSARGAAGESARTKRPARWPNLIEVSSFCSSLEHPVEEAILQRVEQLGQCAGHEHEHHDQEEPVGPELVPLREPPRREHA